jgi:hypothetical protein
VLVEPVIRASIISMAPRLALAWFRLGCLATFGRFATNEHIHKSFEVSEISRRVFYVPDHTFAVFIVAFLVGKSPYQVLGRAQACRIAS